MKKSDMLFAILRKSLVLKDCIKSDDQRKFIINLKYNYSKLLPTLRNMIRIMATDIDRFELQYSTISNINSVLNDTNTEKKYFPRLIDTNTGKVFVIHNDSVMCDSLDIFKNDEHLAFIISYVCLLNAKNHQEKAIRDNAIQQKRMDILSEFI